MEKLLPLIHGMSISDQAAAGNVGAEHRLQAAEMLKTSFSMALSAVQKSLKTTKATEVRKALKASDYEFK